MFFRRKKATGNTRVGILLWERSMYSFVVSVWREWGRRKRGTAYHVVGLWECRRWSCAFEETESGRRGGRGGKEGVFFYTLSSMIIMIARFHRWSLFYSAPLIYHYISPKENIQIEKRYLYCMIDDWLINLTMD